MRRARLCRSERTGSRFRPERERERGRRRRRRRSGARPGRPWVHSARSTALSPLIICLRVRARRRVTAELLCSENGLDKLAKISRDKNSFKRTRNLVRRDAWPSARCCIAPLKRSCAQAVDVRHLVGMYESWARQLLPTVPFPDFVMQLERLSSNGKIQMKQMQIEQGHEDWAADEDIDNVSSHGRTRWSRVFACHTHPPRAHGRRWTQTHRRRRMTGEMREAAE